MCLSKILLRTGIGEKYIDSWMGWLCQRIWDGNDRCEFPFVGKCEIDWLNSLVTGAAMHA